MLLADYFIKGAGTHPDGERTARGGTARSPGTPAGGRRTVVAVIVVARPVPEEIFHIDRLLPVVRQSCRAAVP
ncbi:hypothetical protein ARTHROSP310_36970 [Arthrobacter sp. AD-310]